MAADVVGAVPPAGKGVRRRGHVGAGSGAGLLRGPHGSDAVFPTVVGRPSHQHVMHGHQTQDRYKGEAAFRKQAVLQLTQPGRIDEQAK
eukprot:gene24254-64021_t